MDVSGSQQVFSTGNVCDFLKVVIHYHRKMIGDADIFPCEDGIAIDHRVYLNFSKT